MVVEVPLAGRECFEKTVKQLKQEQFSHEERQDMVLVHDGIELGNDERLFDLILPSQDSALDSPKQTQCIVIHVRERQDEDSMTMEAPENDSVASPALKVQAEGLELLEQL